MDGVTSCGHAARAAAHDRGNCTDVLFRGSQTLALLRQCLRSGDAVGQVVLFVA